MLRVFVTGDNHIGLKYASHEQAGLLASVRISAFENMVQKANEEGCALFVITGDLFENTYGVSKKDIKSLLDILRLFQGTVVVLPGNHDYYDPDVKVWQYFKDVMAAYDNVLLLTEYRPYELNIDEETVVLYPALCTSLHSAPGQNNLGWIKELQIQNDGAYHIGIAHGAVEGETIDSEGRYFLMKRSELEAIPVDAWLIGHTHVPFPRNLTQDFTGGEKIFNAGTHVQTDVSCNTEGLCFVVEIGDDKTVRAKKVISGSLGFCRKTLQAAVDLPVGNKHLINGPAGPERLCQGIAALQLTFRLLHRCRRRATALCGAILPSVTAFFKPSVISFFVHKASSQSKIAHINR